MTPTTQLKQWINDQSTFLIVMTVVNTIIGFIFLIIRSKIPVLWADFDKATFQGAEALLLASALLGLMYLYAYYFVSKRSKFNYYFQLVALLLSFIYLLPIYFAVKNIGIILSPNIKAFYKIV